MRVMVLAAALVVVSSAASAQQAVSFAWDEPLQGPVSGYLFSVGADTYDVGAFQAITVTLAPGTYTATVLAYNADGSGPASNAVSVTVAAPPPPPPPPNPCTADPLDVTVTQWPANKRGTPTYTSDYPIVSVRLQTKGNTVLGATFTDTRGCTDTVTR